MTQLDSAELFKSHPLIGRFANQPTLLLPGSEAWLATCLRGHSDQKYDEDFAGPLALDSRYGETSAEVAFARLGNVAVIPIRGSLIHGSMARDDYATGYDYIRLAAMQADADEDIAGIVYLHNSNGGEVAGNFDLVDDLSRITKPSLAIVDENSYSGSYSLAAAADRITVARTGGVGSVGVLTAHVDVSKALEEFGVSVTLVHSGRHKVDGNPFQPLEDSVKNRMQGRIDGLYNEFVNSVARNRGLSPEVVRGTEALTYTGQEGVDIGLADAVQAPREALAAFIAEMKTKPAGVRTMTVSTEKPIETETVSAITQADLDAARAEGATAERERIRGIMGSDEAKTRPATAHKIALNTGMNVTEATAFLADIPEEKAGAESASASGPGAFEKAMANTGNPGITPDDTVGEEVSASQRILASFNSYTGRKTA